MRLPTMNAHAALAAPPQGYAADGQAHAEPAGAGGVTPQVCVNSPCLRLPSGRFCVNLPILGRRCVNIPGLGSWRVRCCTRWGWPPVSCGVSRC